LHYDFTLLYIVAVHRYLAAEILPRTKMAKRYIVDTEAEG